jgi:hypothetical protein
MNVTRDIVKDLLPVYLAGDASEDTRTLVDQWLRTDPDLTRLVAEAKVEALPPVALPAPDSEKQALSRTRRWLRWRMVLMGTAIYVTTLPMTVVFDSRGFKGLLIEDWWERIVILVVAAALWAAFVAMTRKVRASGL